MGMNSHVVGIKPPDGDWHKMKLVWDACVKAGVGIPDEVEDFFDGEEPDDGGVIVKLDDEPCVSEYRAEMRDGFEVDLRKLPEDIKIIRFYNSY